MEDLPSAPRFDLTVDDTKVSGHTAILPTRNVDRTVLDGLSGDERLTLVRVVRRMWEATADDYVHDTVQVIANLNPHWCESHPDEGCRLSEANAVSPAVPTSREPGMEGDRTGEGRPRG